MSEPTPSPPFEITREARQAVLQNAIAGYLRSGFHVVSQTEFTAQLLKPKKFGCFLFVILFILAVLPAIIYVAYYASKKDETVYLEVDAAGNLIKRS